MNSCNVWSPLMQPEQHVDIELVIHYQMLSSPAKHKAEPAKKATLPEVG